MKITKKIVNQITRKTRFCRNSARYKREMIKFVLYFHSVIISTRRAKVSVRIFIIFEAVWDSEKIFLDLNVSEPKLYAHIYLDFSFDDAEFTGQRNRKLARLAFLSRFYTMFCTRSLVSTHAVSGYDKEPLLKRIGNSRKNNVYRLFQRRDRSRKDRARTGFPGYSHKYIYLLWMDFVGPCIRTFTYRVIGQKLHHRF